MRITIVYDNASVMADLRTGWGFSCLIEVDHGSPLLFDTGADGTDLLHNMRCLNIAPESIGAVVISHGHGDHTGGLSDFLAMNQKASIYVPASTRARIPGRKVIPVSRPLQISGDVFSTGELAAIEQSLCVKTARGIMVVTGCSHPGVGAILKAASDHGQVYGIVGGLHGFRDFDQLEGLSLICPCHCTQYKQELARRFSDQHVGCGAGLSLDLPRLG